MSRWWNRFWFRIDSTVALGLFRILFAVALFREIGTTTSRSVFAIEGGFHLPYVSFIGPVSEQAFQWIQRIQIVPVALLGVGLLTRPAIGALLLLQGYVFFADQLNFRNHPYFFLLLLVLLWFSPCDEALSLKRVWRRARGLPIHDDGYLGSWRPVTAQRLIQVQVSIVYFYAALHKVNPWFLGGHGLVEAMEDLFDGSSGDALRALLSRGTLESLTAFVTDPSHMRWPARAAVVTELFLAFGLWFRRTRPCAIAVGILFHAGIAFTMHIRTFSIATIATDLLIPDPATVPRWLAAAFGEQEQREALDGRCGSPSAPETG